MSHPLTCKTTFCLLVLILSCRICTAQIPEGRETLLQGFISPSKEARPSTYWLWLNGYVNREHVRRELEQFRDKGISGVCLFDMGARGIKEKMPPNGPAFMSEHSVDDIAHAVRVAGELDLNVQLSVSSSWDMGGSWVKPEHASMGLFQSTLTTMGPTKFDQPLPLPSLPTKAPKDDDGKPLFLKNVAVLAVPIKKRLPGHDFIIRMDPPGIHTIHRAVLYNTLSDNPKRHGDQNLFAKDFSIAVSTTDPTSDAFHEVLSSSLAATTDAQSFTIPATEARYVRLRLGQGHNTKFDAVQLAEFELYNEQGVNVVASHEADRSRDGGDLVGYCDQRENVNVWTAQNIIDGSKAGAGGSWSSTGLPPLVIDRLEDIIDLTDRVDADGHLTWNVPDGEWIIMRFVCANTGERLKVPSPNSDGLATDHLNREATITFLDKEIQELQNKLGPLGDTALKQLYLASYEVRGRIWTADLLEQFQSYRGYDMTRYLPALLGHIIVNDEITQRFQYDFRKTLGDLLVDAYYRTAAETAHLAGIGIESEAGGPGPPIHQVPVDALKAQGAIDEIRGEFWPKRPHADQLWVVKETACAGHTYGKRVIHMEAFTSMHHWQDGPFDLKPSADRAFCEGANHMVWHTAAHLPPESGQPGWVYGAGTHLNTNRVWWSKAKPFLDYLARCSFMLQQGKFVADVVYYYGDQGYNFVPPKHVDPSLGQGYDYDVVNREVILNRMSVHQGRITLADGMSYGVLVLPDRQDIDIDVLRKLESLIRDGATVVGAKPTKANGLTDYPQRDLSVRELADKIWGDCDGEKSTEHRYGKGRVRCGPSLGEILANMNAGPDFTFQSSKHDSDLDFIHRRTNTSDIYFIRNKQDTWTNADCAFRASGVPELWDPATGTTQAIVPHEPLGDRTSIPLQLAPYGSVFVVFHHTANTFNGGLKLTEPNEALGLPRTRIESHDTTETQLTVFQNGEHHVVQGSTDARECVVSDLPAPLTLNGPWTITLEKLDGVQPTLTMDRLVPWNENDDEGLRYYSGIGSHHIDFELPESWVTDERRIFLDLGELWAIGTVKLNGHSIGTLWKPPFVVDICSAAVSGKNTLTIEVANTWNNRLVGDASLAPDHRVTRTNISGNNGVAWKDCPLRKSGLFGPVRLIPGKRVSLPSKP
ncbi:hypothetical protein CA13_32670 [Planctomycetes bacterium CA13]|uniref:Glycosyl hydrolases family 2, sugar binding domain n=1 Tax=Novipirellula herctigrandis TaxID=2527986 RepID=A0A5C5Z3E8_9BACT|nr:hypothetical protein CA13_32670 [Planctomycetes bacterium CA13]